METKNTHLYLKQSIMDMDEKTENLNIEVVVLQTFKKLKNQGRFHPYQMTGNKGRIISLTIQIVNSVLASATDKHIYLTGETTAVGPIDVRSIKYNLEIVYLTLK